MKEEHEQNKENWCYFESSVDELLDNYIYLDKSQFEPHRHKNAAG